MKLQKNLRIEHKIKGRALYNEPMRRHTSFCIGGPADIWIEPADIDDLKNCIRLSRYETAPLSIIGGGTNLLVRDEGIRGIVVNMLTAPLKNMWREGRTISVSSAVTMQELLNFCCNEGLGGLEFLAGIPGSVGGAVKTNAGARHYEITNKWHSIGKYVEEIKTMDYRGEIRVFNSKELTFDYKRVDLIDCVILEVKFMLTKTGKEDILDKCRRFLKRKKETQELSLPSAGCIFKNPAGTEKSAGELIDKCNLKGTRIGGAVISGRHANFIVNTGEAKASDVTSLIDVAREKVRERFGIELYLEIKIV